MTDMNRPKHMRQRETPAEGEGAPSESSGAAGAGPHARGSASAPQASRVSTPSSQVKASQTSPTDGRSKSPETPHASRRRTVLLTAVLAVCLVVAVGGAVALSGVLSAGDRAQERQEQTPVPKTDVQADDELPENPIDFAEQQEISADIYAWIYIPGTGINLPIVQSSVDDTFYLRRDVTGASDVYGSIFTQSMNARDFSDPVTLIYGHDTDNGTMFGDLHEFEDQTFFNEHEDLYIYTPGHILRYRIIAAYVYDDRHIMNSFDFSDLAVRQRYFDAVLNPTSMVKNVREGASLTTDDKIVQLSTCNGVATSDNTRYLVTGVLVDDQATQ